MTKCILIGIDGMTQMGFKTANTPIMNKLINKYLAAMDFFVQFELDQNFNESIKSRLDL